MDIFHCCIETWQLIDLHSIEVHVRNDSVLVVQAIGIVYVLLNSPKSCSCGSSVTQIWIGAGEEFLVLQKGAFIKWRHITGIAK